MSRVSVRGTWLCLTLVRPMAWLTLGVILPVRPGPPSPSPETAGLLDREVGGSRRAADAGSLSETGALGPPPGGQINPVPFRAEDTQWDEYVQSLIRKIGPSSARLGPAPPPILPWPSCGWAHCCVWWPRHGHWISRPAHGLGRVTPSLAGLRRAGRCLRGLPCGGSADAKPTKRWREEGFILPVLLVRTHTTPSDVPGQAATQGHVPLPCGCGSVATPGPQEVPELPAHPPVRPRSEFSPATPHGPHLVLVTTARRPSPTRGAPARSDQKEARE